MTRRWIKQQMKELESWAQRKPDMTLTVGYAQVAICKLPLTNGAKVSPAPLPTNLQQALEFTLTAKAMSRPFSPMATD
ncbi:unnamed protein product [Miscanthus lutarioriparius]|uniref:Uncharacterized protein n=1 Tax=Miscanthus lutarioriparius TaxID=422564 RepID=A0A811MRD1_9POAL|nr:unnamed protein product [Miscanthus lutarioriparius]